MELIKEWRIWVLIIVILLCILAISPNPWAKGVIVNEINKNSPFMGHVHIGDKITSINEKTIANEEDFYGFEKYDGMLRAVSNGKLVLVNKGSSGLGVIVKDVPQINLNFGMDLIGGTRVLLKPQYKNKSLTSDEQGRIVDQTVSTLETRMNIYGLKEMNFRSVTDVEGNKYVQIEIAGASKKEIDDLLSRQGIFEAYISRVVNFKNGTGVLTLKNKTFDINKGENFTVQIQNKILKVNDTINLDNITFEVWNITNYSAILAGKVYTSENIRFVYFDPQHSYLKKLADGWEFAFQILIDKEGAEKFGEVTKDISSIVDPDSGRMYLKEKIYLFLDKKMVSSLRISAGLRGEPYTTPMITGGGKTQKEASYEQKRLQSVLRSGKLPTKLKIVEVNTISPSLGGNFINEVLMAGLGALIGVTIVIFIRYRTLKITLPVLMTSICEIIIVLGVAAIIKWTIDLPAIAGIIAAIGSGVDDQIVITDGVMHGEKEKRSYTVKQRIKRAFFIILGSAATVIAAMLPLTFIGIGAMRGFAITTVIGVLGGISITRPAYGKIIEKLMG